MYKAQMKTIKKSRTLELMKWWNEKMRCLRIDYSYYFLIVGLLLIINGFQETMMSQQVGPFGGNKGDTFDDGHGYDDVKKVLVGENIHGVTCIKIEYAKDGKFETRVHGNSTETLKEFALNYSDEYITSIQGTYSNVTYYGTTIVKTLTFKTSHGRTSPMFGKTAIFNTAFVVEGICGEKLMGFHGRSSGDVLYAIGAHFFKSSSPLRPLEPRGGIAGGAWDDGGYNGVRKILVGQDGNSLSYVKFEYVNGTILILHSHGKRKQEPKEFLLEPNEHITSVEGTYDHFVTSLTFKTTKGKTSSTFGKVVGTKFVFAEKEYVVVGFRSRSSDLIDALGAHFLHAALIPPVPVAPVPVPAKKLEAKGGNGGATWDDGFYEDVRKIYVGQGDSGVSFVKFEYANGKELVAGDGHGMMSLLGTEEFVLDFPNEYIVSVEGCYDKVFGIEADVVTMLRFKTNKRTSTPFGLDGGTTFVLEMKDHKIVGFHGKAGDFVHQVGVHVSPLSKS